jgi:uncharacterized membrane protein (DUF485 family)
MKKFSKSFTLIFLISIFSIILFIPQSSSALNSPVFPGFDIEYHGLPCCVCPSYFVYNCYCMFMG